MAQDSRQAGALEIEITPAMIEAGRSLLSLAFLNGEPSDGEASLVREIFDAMLEASDAPLTIQHNLPPVGV